MNPQSRLFGVWVDAYGNGEQGDISGSQGRTFVFSGRLARPFAKCLHFLLFICFTGWHIGLARSQQVYWKMKDSINSAEVCGRGTPANITVVYEKSNLRVFLNDNLVPVRTIYFFFLAKPNRSPDAKPHFPPPHVRN